jgi:hypothetical protein
VPPFARLKGENNMKKLFLTLAVAASVIPCAIVFTGCGLSNPFKKVPSDAASTTPATPTTPNTPTNPDPDPADNTEPNPVTPPAEPVEYIPNGNGMKFLAKTTLFFINGYFTCDDSYKDNIKIGEQVQCYDGLNQPITSGGKTHFYITEKGRKYDFENAQYDVISCSGYNISVFDHLPIETNISDEPIYIFSTVLGKNQTEYPDPKLSIPTGNGTPLLGITTATNWNGVVGVMEEYAGNFHQGDKIEIYTAANEKLGSLFTISNIWDSMTYEGEFYKKALIVEGSLLYRKNNSLWFTTTTNVPLYIFAVPQQISHPVTFLLNDEIYDEQQVANNGFVAAVSSPNYFYYDEYNRKYVFWRWNLTPEYEWGTFDFDYQKHAITQDTIFYALFQMMVSMA